MNRDDSRNERAVALVGHRTLEDPDSVRRALADLMAGLGTGWTLLTSLAEGTDRLGAEIALAIPDVRLHAVLPMVPQEFREDFATAASRRQFDDLLRCAAVIEITPRGLDRPGCYASASRRVVDLSDVLIVVWDGKPARGRGGTADAVAQARVRGVPLCLIDAGNPERIVFERCKDPSGPSNGA